MGKKRGKKRKKGEGGDAEPVPAHSTSGSNGWKGRPPAQLSSKPWFCPEEDHCETPPVAFQHIEPLLSLVSKRIGRAKAELSIYDPFYCQGSMKLHLKDLGFSDVYNEPVDFYGQAQVPDFDVLVSNPPFSGDHISNLFEFAEKRGKPFFLLLPNFVCCKQYFTQVSCFREATFLFTASVLFLPS